MMGDLIDRNVKEIKQRFLDLGHSNAVKMVDYVEHEIQSLQQSLKEAEARFLREQKEANELSVKCLKLEKFIDLLDERMDDSIMAGSYNSRRTEAWNESVEYEKRLTAPTPP